MSSMPPDPDDPHTAAAAGLERLHPQARRAMAEAEGDPPVWEIADLAGVRAQDRAVALSEERERVAVVRDVVAGGVPARVYHPAQPSGPVPVVVHLHGGGFVLNDIEVHDALARRLARRSGLAVLSVDYRLAPEDPFPAAPDDVDAALGWLRSEGPSYGLDPQRILLHGDSAGANLAVVAAWRNPGLVRAMALVYPFLDARMGAASWSEARGAFGPRTGAWYWQQYAGEGGHPGRWESLLDDPEFSPAAMDDLEMTTLPPTLVVTAEYDPCRDEGEELAGRLAAAGVHTIGTRVLGMLHGFYRHDAFDAAEPTLRQVAGFLAQHAGTPHGG